MPFHDRSDAGRKLARALAHYKDRYPVILALPRGGVPVAAEVAAALDAPLDLVLVRKIGVPMQPEYAMGAVMDGAKPIIIRNEDVIRDAGITAAEFDKVGQKELAEIERRRRLYFGNRPRADLTGRVVIVIDDGIATGATMKAALAAIRKLEPKELVLAVPVAPADAIRDLRREVDDLVCMHAPAIFGAVGYFYDDFRQVGDEEVIATLAKFPASSGSHVA